MKKRTVTRSPSGVRAPIDKISDVQATTIVNWSETRFNIDGHVATGTASLAFKHIDVGAPSMHFPASAFGTADHCAATSDSLDGPQDLVLVPGLVGLKLASATLRIARFGLGIPVQHFADVIRPDPGITVPGLVMVCHDSQLCS